MSQLKLHKKIDTFFSLDIRAVQLEDSRDLLVNDDSKRYFFSKADEKWIAWLFVNGFFDVLGEMSDSVLGMPELAYLARVAEREPEITAKIILSIKFSSKKFNPEVINRFLWILGELPVKEIKNLTYKIKEEKWVRLMGGLRKSGYEYEKIFQKLSSAHEYTSLLELAESIFDIKKINKDNSQCIVIDEPFYLHDVQASGVYPALADVGDLYVEKALKIATDVFGQIVMLAKRDEEGVFEYYDQFSLSDIDFFTFEIGGLHMTSYREDVKYLAWTIKKLADRSVAANCANNSKVKKIFFTYFDQLPSCRSVWGLKLYVLAQCPQVFKKELKNMFFKLFDVGDKSFEIQGRIEYEKALKIGFEYLSDSDKRSYISEVLKYFTAKAIENRDQDWHSRNGWQLLSSIYKHLSKEEITLCKVNFGIDCDSEYLPESREISVRSGTVHHKSPADIATLEIQEIVNKLKAEWSPEALKEAFREDDFLLPRGAEGLSDAIKDDVKSRTKDYLDNINLFFDRGSIHSVYLWSVLRGVEDIIREGKDLESINWGKLIGLFDNIVVSGKDSQFERDSNNLYLADWITVHNTIADILLYSIDTGNNDALFTFSEFRDRVLLLIVYLLGINDPIKEDNMEGRGDLYSIAINTVRGRAFQSLTSFLYHDAQSFSVDSESKINDDVKKIYEDLLRSETRLPVRFVIGHNLASFYYRDKNWIRGLFMDIFPKDAAKRDIFFAAWEGYLTSDIYKEVYEDLREYYQRAISIDSSEYPDYKYFKDLDEGLAIHVALAFAHFDGFEGELFSEFWEKANTKRQKEFIVLLGKSFLSSSQSSGSWLKENGINKDRLMKFWGWVFKRDNVDPEVFSAFGWWISPDTEVLNYEWLSGRMAETLQKSGGMIEWDYGLIKQLPNLAKAASKDTLRIINSYLLQDGALNPHRERWIQIDSKFMDSLSTIYNDEETKDQVYSLVDKLIEVGGERFWRLKSVIKEYPN